jgi:hypothetical protein
LAGIAAAGGVGWLGYAWLVASFVAFGRPVRRLFLLLLLWLFLLLMWLLGFDMCNFRGHSLIEEFVQGVKPAAGGCHQSNFVQDSVAEAYPGNIVKDFIMLL